MTKKGKILLGTTLAGLIGAVALAGAVHADSERHGRGYGPGFDGGFDVHEGRAGVRYQFGGGNPGCGKKQEFIPYEPEPLPPVVYK